MTLLLRTSLVVTAIPIAVNGSKPFQKRREFGIDVGVRRSFAFGWRLFRVRVALETREQAVELGIGLRLRSIHAPHKRVFRRSRLSPLQTHLLHLLRSR